MTHPFPPRRSSDLNSGGHVARGAASMLFAQLESGVLCPTAITYGVVPMMWQQPDLAEQWEPLMVSKDYDPRPIPHGEKSGISIAFTATRSEEHTSELQSLMRISYAVFCLKK